MNWTLLVTKPAQKDLEKLPSRDQVRIERALDSLQIDPFSGDIKRLQQHDVSYRLRMGDYRVLFDVEGDVIVIRRIGNRRDVYD